jgi:Spy/CpxP family protein refolding chaperone
VSLSRPGLSVALYLSLTFVSGAAVGGFGFWLYTNRSVQAANNVRRIVPEEFRSRYVQEMQNRLKLTPEQTKKMTEILDTTSALFNEINEKHRPEYEAIQQNQTSQIRAMLTPEQADEFEKFRKERESHRRKGPRGQGSGPH